MNSHRLREFATTGEMAQAAAKRFSRAARQALDERGRFVVVVPGGSTPRRVFSLLTTPAFRDSIDWARVHLVPSDERLVSPADPDSNSRMIREELLDGLGCDQSRCNFYPPLLERGLTPGERRLTPGERGLSPEEVALRWEARLRELFAPGQLVDGLPVFDFALLGMGGDGHTASLFPGDSALTERARWCVAVEPRGEPAVARATLTLPVLSHARAVCFIATGAEKSALIKRIIAAKEPLPGCPASQVAAKETGWLVV